MVCRFCKTELRHVFVDLFHAPASNSFLNQQQLNEPEVSYPLKVFTCSNCFLVQVDEYQKSGAIFNNEYVYFSSFSSSWLEHARAYVEMMTNRFALNSSSLVMEVASNDGYLLQYFYQRQIPVLGVEPTSNTAQVAIEKGIETHVDFFGTALAQRLVEAGRTADVLLGNNVLAHVPDILDFVKGMKMVLKATGVITMEFPHLLRLVAQNQFDTIYHEHFSYLSFSTVRKIFQSQGLELFDVEELPTHGGSIRIYARHLEDQSQPITPNVARMIQMELDAGMETLEFYQGFQQKALRIKMDFLLFLIEQKKQGKKVAAYGAAAKGNTLLNYCGIKNDLIEFVSDANPHKQGKWLPSSHIPVFDESCLKSARPDFVVIFPWNLKDEIVRQLGYVREWGGQFVIAIPELTVF